MKQSHLCLTTVKIAYTPVKELECIQEANGQTCAWDASNWTPLIGQTSHTAREAGRNKLALHESYAHLSKENSLLIYDIPESSKEK